MGETQIYSRQERSDLNTSSYQMDLKYVRCKVEETLYLWMTSLGELGLGSGFMRCEIWSKFETQVTYKLITRSEIKVLAKDEDVHCLGKRDQCREGKNMIGAI